MNFKLLALTLCMATLSFVNLRAEDSKLTRKSIAGVKLLSKGEASLPFYSASDKSTVTLFGATTASYVALPFTRDIDVNGKGIKANKNGDQFRLNKGTYLILFSGTFQAHGLADSEAVDFAYLEVALQVGPNIIFINTDSHNLLEDGEDANGISSISKVIEVDEPTTLSLVVRDVSNDTSVIATTRSLSIIRLK
jgi:hypothetical protein